MIVMLTKEKVTERWEHLRSYIMDALPPFAKANVYTEMSILRAILTDHLKVWTVYEETEESAIEYAIVTTQVMIDKISYSKNLLIYSLYGAQEIPDYLWHDSLAKLRGYAKTEGCVQILAYTARPALVKLAHEMGAEELQALIAFEVEDQ